MQRAGVGKYMRITRKCFEIFLGVVSEIWLTDPPPSLSKQAMNGTPMPE